MKVLRKEFSHRPHHDLMRGGKTLDFEGNLCLLSHFADGKIRERLGMRSGHELNHFRETTMNLVATQ